VSYLIRGRSGTHVCRLDVERADYPRQTFFLKLSLDKRMLEHEYRANRSAGRILGEQALVSIIRGVRSDASGYHAIAGRLAENTISLADWLGRIADVDQAGVVAEILLGEVLAPLFYQESQVRAPILDWIASSPIEIVQARAALAQYAPAISDSRAGGCRTADRELKQLGVLLETRELPVSKGTAVPSEVEFVWSFGDLRSTNILVQDGVAPRPILMDSSSFDRRHWASDSARLLADAFLRVRRPGVESMIWDDIGDSVRSGLHLCPFCDREPDISPEPVEEFIYRCVSRLQDYTHSSALGISEADWHWQWHMALAKEFVHQPLYNDLTPPRGALAVLLASHHLQRSIELLESFV
jgi:hypothetical protein